MYEKRIETHAVEALIERYVRRGRRAGTAESADDVPGVAIQYVSVAAGSRAAALSRAPAPGVTLRRTSRPVDRPAGREDLRVHSGRDDLDAVRGGRVVIDQLLPLGGRVGDEQCGGRGDLLFRCLPLLRFRGAPVPGVLHGGNRVHGVRQGGAEGVRDGQSGQPREPVVGVHDPAAVIALAATGRGQHPRGRAGRGCVGPSRPGPPIWRDRPGASRWSGRRRPRSPGR